MNQKPIYNKPQFPQIQPKPVNQLGKLMAYQNGNGNYRSVK